MLNAKPPEDMSQEELDAALKEGLEQGDGEYWTEAWLTEMMRRDIVRELHVALKTGAPLTDLTGHEKSVILCTDERIAAAKQNIPSDRHHIKP